MLLEIPRQIKARSAPGDVQPEGAETTAHPNWEGRAVKAAHACCEGSQGTEGTTSTGSELSMLFIGLRYKEW